MKSKRIWVAKDYDVGYKSKSHMAEFSPNPDGRNKRDTSFKEYNKRLMMAENLKMTNRISVNKLRDEKKLPPFLNQNEYDEIVEESELEGQNLFNLLINYNMKNTLDENIKNSNKYEEKKSILPKIIIKEDRVYVNLDELSTYLCIDIDKLFSCFESLLFVNYIIPYDKKEKYLIHFRCIVLKIEEILMFGKNEVLIPKLSILYLELKNLKTNSPYLKYIASTYYEEYLDVLIWLKRTK